MSQARLRKQNVLVTKSGKMSGSSATPGQASSRSFHFDQLPNEAQALVCSLAATPGCPAHVLLACVKRNWGAAAAEFFTSDAASITLELSCDSSSPVEQKRREVQRLSSLSAWLRRYGPSLNKLAVTLPEDEDESEQYVLGRGQGVTGILEALAAAGKRLGALPLQQLHVPGVGGAPPATITSALSACPQLRQLQLGYTCGPEPIAPDKYLLGDLPAALQRLSHLTLLDFAIGGFKWDPSRRGCGCLDGFFEGLPRSLVNLKVKFIHSSFPFPFYMVKPNSLQHLVALKRLTLPEGVHVTSQEPPDQSLAALTALTRLEYDRALVDYNKALLTPPNLVEIWTHYAEPQQLLALHPMAALRTLDLTVLLDDADDSGPAALAQLTQLTQLWLLVNEGAEHPDAPPAAAAGAAAGPDAAAPAAEVEGAGAPAAEEEGAGAPAAAAAVATAWGTAMSSLTGLQRLAVEPGMLPRMDFAALTALTKLVVRTDWFAEAYTQQRLEQLLGGLAAGRGRLQEVTLLCVEDAQQAPCRAALAAALGDVEVSFV